MSVKKSVLTIFLSILVCVLACATLVNANVQGILAYGEGGETIPRVRHWNGTGWGPEYNASNLGPGSLINWIVVKAAPTREEYIMVIRDANDRIVAQLNRSHNGTPCWGDGITCGSVMVITNTTIPTPDLRSFDVEYEGVSSRAIIVFSDNTSDLKYITWNGTTWSSIQSLGQTRLTGIIRWVELTGRPNTNFIAAAFSDTNHHLSALEWNGSSWGCEPTAALATNLPPTDYKSFDAAYEGASGDLFIMSGIAGVEDLRRHTKPAGSCTYTTTTVTAYAEIGNLVDVSESIPGVDMIIIAEANATDADHHAGVWNGTADRAVGCADTTMGTFAVARKMTAAGYLGFPGREGIVVYSDSTGTTIDWCTYNATSNTWTIQTDFTPTPGIGVETNIEIYRFPNETRVMVIISDVNADLWAKIYNGTTWLNTEGGAALELNLSTINFQNFDFAFRLFRPAGANHSFSGILEMSFNIPMFRNFVYLIVQRQTISQTTYFVKLQSLVRPFSERLAFNSNTEKIFSSRKFLVQGITSDIKAIMSKGFLKSAYEFFATSTSVSDIYRISRDFTQRLANNLQIVKVSSIIKSFSQSINAYFSTLYSKIFNVNSIFSTSISTASSRVYSFVKSLTNVFTLNQNFEKLYDYFRNFLQSLNLSNISKNTSNFLRFVSQKVTSNAFTTRITSFIKIFSQAINENLFITQMRSIPVISLQAVSYNLNVTKIQAIFKTVSQSISSAQLEIVNRIYKISSTLSASLNSFTLEFTSFIKSLSDTITTNIVTKNLSGFLKTLSQPIKSNNIVTSFFGTVKSLSQTITYNFSLNRFLSIFNLQTQPLNLNNIASKFAVFPKNIRETFSISTLTTRLSAFFIVTNQRISSSILGVIQTAQIFAQDIAQTINSNIIVVSFKSFVRNMHETFNANLNIARVTSLIRSLTQNITSNISSLKIVNYFESLSQLISANISVKRIFGFFEVMQQSMPIKIMTDRLLAFTKPITQSINYNALVNLIVKFYQDVNQGLSLNSITQRTISITRNFVQFITSDMVSIRFSEFFRVLSQSISSSIKTVNQISKFIVLSTSTNLGNAAQKIFETAKDVATTINSNFNVARILTIFRSLPQTLTASQSTIINRLTGFSVYLSTKLLTELMKSYLY